MLKLIVGLGAVAVTVAFIVSGVVFAQSNEPVPGDYLNSTQLSDFNSLRADVKAGLEQGFLPDLASKTDLTEEFKKQFFAAVVEAEKNAPAPGSSHFHAKDQTHEHFHCSELPNISFSVGSTVGAFSSASCQQTIRSFTSSVQIFGGPTKYAYDSRNYRFATYASSWVYADYSADTEYKYCGTFTAVVLDLPAPRPSKANTCGWYYT
ncbi:MAG: hypothetical protein OXD46_09495 [Chloroflexi bacterium]|nr:hypothetical protein [Chloroflexota bacterium]